MNKILNYCILPFQTPFRYHDVIDSIKIKDDRYWYWSFSIIEDKVEKGYIELFIKSVLSLFNGIVFSYKDDWELVLSPTFSYS